MLYGHTSHVFSLSHYVEILSLCAVTSQFGKCNTMITDFIFLFTRNRAVSVLVGVSMIYARTFRNSGGVRFYSHVTPYCLG